MASSGGTGGRQPKPNYNQPSNPGSENMSKIKSVAAGKVDSGDGPPQNSTGRYKTS